MHRALRLAGRARPYRARTPCRSATGRRGVFLRLVGADEILEQAIAVRIAARHDDVIEVGTVRNDVLESRKQRFRHDQRLGATVGQHEAIVVLGKQRVHRHGDNAGLETAKKRGRPIDRVGERHQHALLAANTETAQGRAEAVHTIGQLAVGPDAAPIDKGRLAGAAGTEIGVQHIGGKIIMACGIVGAGAHRTARAALRRDFFRDRHFVFLPKYSGIMQ